MSLATLLVGAVFLIPSTQSAAAAPCPNEALRVGASAKLPDCRAYELVTPEATGQVFHAIEPENPGFYNDLFPSEPVSVSGDSLVLSTRGYGLDSPQGGGEGVQSPEIYETQRAEGGWVIARHVIPGPEQMAKPLPGGISPDHRFVFVHAGPATSGKEGGELGSLYIDRGADYLGDGQGRFELTGMGSLGTEQYAQGRYISAGGAHVIFTTGKAPPESQWCSIANTLCKVKKLEPQAAPEGTGTIYDRSADGPTRVISLLPGDTPQLAGQNAVYRGVSADGNSVAFTIGTTFYVRVNDEKTDQVTTEPVIYGGFSADGRYLFYVSEGDVHRFDCSTESDEEVNSSGDAVMMNVSADGSHVYFISPSKLDAQATAGEPNIYVWSGGAPKFVATVLETDVQPSSGSGLTPGLGKWTQGISSAETSALEAFRGPGVDPSRTTPDGTVAVFESAAKLTSYDNAGHTEIYRFKEGEGILCVSCNPLSVQATKDARLQGLGETGPEIVLHNLSEDGSRVFFETEEALVSGDVDGINDAYEWEAGSPLETPRLALISSGRSANLTLASFVGMEQNTLMGITPDGDNVFFKSQDALAAGAPTGNAPVIYDARVGGGFPAPEVPFPCSEEGCKLPVTPPPTLASAGSAGLHGTGNAAPKRLGHHHKHRAKKHRSQRRHHACGRKSGHRACSRKRLAEASVSGVAAVPAVASTPAALLPAPTGASTTPAADLLAATPLAAVDRPRTASTVTGGEYALESVQAELSTYAAGRHPDFTTRLQFNTPRFESGSPKTEEVVTNLPPGLYGNPNPSVIPRCSTGEFIGESCSIDSQVGVLHVTYGVGGGNHLTTPLFNLEPTYPGRQVARFGATFVDSVGVYIDASVRTAGDYGVTATVRDTWSLYPLDSVEAVLWGDPEAPVHDDLRMTAPEAFHCGNAPCAGEQSSNLPPVAFMTNPSACQPMSVGFEVASYQFPGQRLGAEGPMSPIGECHGLPFAPSFEATPTSHAAGAPTGLDTVLKLPQSDIHDPSVPSTATMREARVTLPEGMTIASGAADGLAACSVAQVHLHEEVDAACPDASKLGSLKIVSPALAEPIEGAVYQRTPEPGHLFRLWLVADEFGLHVKLPGEILPDPVTGRLTAVFADLPQVPVEEIDLDVWGGPRAPLKNPDTCGTYQTSFSFAPHSEDPAVTGQAAMRIDEGCGARGFSPQLHGGTTDPVAGGYSPFVLDLIRGDGEQNVKGFKVTLPEGLLARLAGVPLCGDAQAASGACPGGSRIGSVTAAAGPGPDPLWIPQPGKAPTAVYLAGPYQGAPYSVVSVVPAQAGPFDLGDVIVRSPLRVDPQTAQATVEAEPLPQIIEGVPITYRDLHVAIDRPGFVINPTSCAEKAITSEVTSTQGTLAHPAERFEVDACRALGFKPRLKIRLKGATGRIGHPALKAVLAARPGEANIGRAQVNLPHGEFLDQGNLNKTCTRPVLLAGRCPASSVYGHAKAWTPLLDKPLEGPVYLVGGFGYKLPALVAELGGQIRVLLVGKIDSGKNKGIRSTFEAVPDAPVSRFVLAMKGGRRYGLLENSEDLCTAKKSRRRAIVRFTGQNGKVRHFKPVVANQCAKKKPRHKRRAKGKSARGHGKHG